MADATELPDTEGRPDDGPVPEFRIVVRHPDRRGPLAPYRFLISVLVVVVVLGPSLYQSVVTGPPDDGVLVRAAVLGLIVWVTTGVVSKALGAAETSTG